MIKRLDLIWVVLALAATVLGIWLGVAGADISPIVSEVPFDGGGGGLVP